MEARPQEIIFSEDGDVKEWLDALELRDGDAYYDVLIRMERVEDGNFGDCGPVGEGVHELRFIKTGPGYRIYFGQHDDIVVLLTAGTKKSQQEDIKRARQLWRGYKNG